MKNNSGYIAIASMLVIATVVLSIGITVNLTSINTAQTSLSHKKSQEALYLTESCIEEYLLKIYNDNNEPYETIFLPEGTCVIELESQAGNNYIFTTEIEFEKYYKKIRVEAKKGTNINITNWKQI